MRKLFIPIAMFATLPWVLGAQSATQTNKTTTQGVMSAKSSSLMQSTELASRRIVYTLAEEANYVTGCFPPCMCPLKLAPNIRGTFELRRVISQDTSFRAFAIDNVNWLVTTASLPEGDQELFITGSGQYRVSSSGGSTQQELVLQLQVGDSEPAQFSSGIVPGGSMSGLPTIDVAINMNNLQCFDILIGVVAGPLAGSGVSPYGLTLDATRALGCVPPCLCPITLAGLSGDFGLVALTSPNPNFTEFAVVGIDWEIGPLPPAPPVFDGDPVRGAGIYRIANDASGNQEMLLNLIQGNTAQRYESGLVSGASFPNINIAVALNDFFCFDEIFGVQAAPTP